MDESLIEINNILGNTNYSCSLSSDGLKARKDLLKNQIVPAMLDRNISQGAYVISFPYNTNIAHTLLDFVLVEQECCKFFQFDLVFLKENERIKLIVSSETVDQTVLVELINTILD